MTAVITQAIVVGGHDGRAEIEVEITYDNGGVATISLDEEACTASLDRAGVTSVDELVGRPWHVVLPSPDPTATATDTSLDPPIEGTSPCSTSSSATD